jgi:hypothetical protein
MDPISLAASTVAGISRPSQVISLLSDTIREFKEAPLVLRQIRDELGRLQQNLQLLNTLSQIITPDALKDTAVLISPLLAPLPLRHDLTRLDRYIREYMPLAQASQKSNLILRGIRQAAVWNSVRKDKDLPKLKDRLASYNQLISTYIQTKL